MALDTTAADAVLTERWFNNGLAQEQIVRDMPTLMIMKHKASEASGKTWHQPVKHTFPQGYGKDYSAANSHESSSSYVDFTGSYQKKVGLCRVDADVIRRAKKQSDILIDHIDAEMKGALYGIQHAIGTELFGNGGGATGREGGTWTSGNVLTLLPGQAHLFEVNQRIYASATDGTSGAIKGGSTFVTAVNADANTITVDDITDISGFAQDDFIFANDFFGAGLSGIGGYIPLTPGTFRGVVQTVNPSRLAGSRVTAASNVADTLNKLYSAIRKNRVPGNLDYCALHPDDFLTLQNELEDRKRLVPGLIKGEAGTYMENLQVETVKVGSVEVYADPYCTKDAAFMLSSDSWTLEHMGDELVNVADEDGMKFARYYNGDIYECRLWFLGDILCSAPGANGRAALP